MNRTPIEWCRTYAADGSFEEGFSVNPVRFKPRGATRLVTMCQKVSPGCAHCYAETITRRFWPKDADEKFPGYTAQGILAGDFVLDEKALESVLKRRKPARIFWGDMTDLFGEWVPDVYLDRCNAVVALTPQHTHMFLTKRTERMYRYYGATRVEQQVREAMIGFQVSQIHLKRTGEPVSEWSGLPMPNLLLGTSVENQEQANIRIPFLLQTPAAVRYLSIEPLLGYVSLNGVIVDVGAPGLPNGALLDSLDSSIYEDGRHIAWVIVGGESGPGARPMHPDWARSLQKQCDAAGVPFFFKQWGAYGPGSVHMTTGEPVFRQFENKLRWEHKGDTWINGGICLDATGRRLRIGGDFDTAVYPVTVMHLMSKKAGGALLDGKEYREFPEVTRG